MAELPVTRPPRSTRSVVGAAVLLLHLLVLAAWLGGAQQAASRSARPEGRALPAKQIMYLAMPSITSSEPPGMTRRRSELAASSVASAVERRALAAPLAPPAAVAASAVPPLRREPSTALAAMKDGPTGGLTDGLTDGLTGASSGTSAPALEAAAGLASPGRSPDSGLAGTPALPPTSAGPPPVAAPVRVAARAVPGNTLPAYPEAAREDGLQGIVHLQVQLDARGRVLAVQWLHRSGVMLLDLAAREAVRGWRFEPARIDGEAVATALTVSIRFQLEQPVTVTLAAA